jgi:mannose-1-phosphate guanylyltransferase
MVVTIGIRPTAPETGYGYIELGGELPSAPGMPVGSPDVSNGARLVARFVEKPDRPTAERYLASGRYLWNSGMFFFRADRILGAIDQHLPELGRLLAELRRDPSRASELYPTAPAISIDYGVMEKLTAGEIAVVPGDFGWSDVGSFTALADVTPSDAQGNVTVGDAVTIDAAGNVLYAEPGKLVAALGVSDLVIVNAGNAVLVLPKSRAQEIKEIIRALETTGRGTYL